MGCFLSKEERQRDAELVAAAACGDVAAAQAALDSGADKDRKDAEVRCG
jgi:hypothetical protein